MDLDDPEWEIGTLPDSPIAAIGSIAAGRPLAILKYPEAIFPEMEDLPSAALRQISRLDPLVQLVTLDLCEAEFGSRCGVRGCG